MAKSQLTKVRTIKEAVSVKGLLSEDATYITYTDEDKEEREISIADCLSLFKGKCISFSVSVVKDEELTADEE